MTTSPSIRPSATPTLPQAGLGAAFSATQVEQTAEDKGRTPLNDDIALSTDQAELLWRAKQDQRDWTDAEHQRIQRQVTVLALNSAPTISGREAVLRQMESLRHGLNEQGVALITRKAAVALEVNPVSLTSPAREPALLRVF